MSRVRQQAEQRPAHATKSGETGHESPSRLQDLVKKGDCAAIKKNENLINAGNRDYLLTLAVMDFKTTPKRPSHVELVKFLIQLGAKPDFHLVCAATVGPHTDIMTALIEAGAEHNIFTAAASARWTGFVACSPQIRCWPSKPQIVRMKKT